MPPSVIQVVLITASPKIRHRATKATQFSKRIHLIGTVDDVQAALLMDGEPPEVILLDVGVRGVNGVADIRALLMEFPDADIIALISFLDGITGEETIKAGAIGHLPRNSLTDCMLTEAIILAHNGLRFRIPALIDPAVPTVILYRVPIVGRATPEF